MEGDYIEVPELEFPKDVVMVKMQPIAKPAPHFFYERPDGVIVDLGEKEAALMRKHSPVKYGRMKAIGYSDGNASIHYLKTCGVRVGEKIPYPKAQEIMRAALAAELEAARGHWREPIYNPVTFGDEKALADAGAIARELPR